MRFEWDETKNTVNAVKHGINFEDIVDVFNHPMLSMLDDRYDYGEERWTAIGLMKGMVGVVVYTERQDDLIRIISTRKATKREVIRYEQCF